MRILTIILMVFIVLMSQPVQGQTNQYHAFEENVTWRYDLRTDIPFVVSNDKLIFDVSTLVNGLYFVRINTRDKVIFKRFSTGR